MKAVALGFSIAVAITASARAQVNADDLKWGPAPPIFAKGAQIAVLAGDPSKPGQFVVRLKVPAGYKFAPHHHPTDEYVTVVSGDFSLGMGDKLDASKGAALRPGGFAMAPANMNHYAWTNGGAIVQVSADGPFVVIYANPADDPTKQ